MTKAVMPRHEALIAADLDVDEMDRRAVTAAILKMLEEDRRLAYATKQPAVAVSASVAIAKLLDLFEGAATASVTVTITGSDRNLL